MFLIKQKAKNNNETLKLFTKKWIRGGTKEVEFLWFKSKASVKM